MFILLNLISNENVKKYLFVIDGMSSDVKTHGLRTPNKGINQRILKFRAYIMADKICFSRTYKSEIGI